MYRRNFSSVTSPLRHSRLHAHARARAPTDRRHLHDKYRQPPTRRALVHRPLRWVVAACAECCVCASQSTTYAQRQREAAVRDVAVQYVARWLLGLCEWHEVPQLQGGPSAMPRRRRGGRESREGKGGCGGCTGDSCRRGTGCNDEGGRGRLRGKRAGCTMCGGAVEGSVRSAWRREGGGVGCDCDVQSSMRRMHQDVREWRA
jgi:hypothetical protein